MKVVTNGVPSFFKMSKEEQKAFFQDSALIAEIIERKREKTKKEQQQFAEAAEQKHPLI